MRWARFAIVGCGSLIACDLPTAPDFPITDLHSFRPPARYATWWSLVERCSGRTGLFASVSWFETKGGGPIEIDGGEYGGYWWKSGNRIALENRNYGPTVRHEMLHALLGSGDHPRRIFGGTCEGVVSFDRYDPEGVEAIRAELARTVAADSVLQVSIVADPESPHVSEDGGWFTYVVTAVNRSKNAVWVPVKGDLIGLYVYDSDEQFGTGMFTKAARVYFAPGQQRRLVLDSHAERAGTFMVSGAYAGAHSPWTAVTFRP